MATELAAGDDGGGAKSNPTNPNLNQTAKLKSNYAMWFRHRFLSRRFRWASVETSELAINKQSLENPSGNPIKMWFRCKLQCNVRLLVGVQNAFAGVREFIEFSRRVEHEPEKNHISSSAEKHARNVFTFVQLRERTDANGIYRTPMNCIGVEWLKNAEVV